MLLLAASSGTVLTACAAATQADSLRKIDRADELSAQAEHTDVAALLRSQSEVARTAVERRALAFAGARWGKQAYEDGELVSARDMFRTTVELCRPELESTVLADALLNVANVELMLSNHQAAEIALREALELGRRWGLTETQLRGEVDRCLYLYNLRRFDEADAGLSELVESPRLDGLPVLRARATMLRGGVLRQQGNLAGAESWYARAVELAREHAAGTDERKVIEDALRNLGELQKAIGSPAALVTARAHLMEAQSIARDLGLPLQAAMSELHLAEVDRLEGRDEAAEVRFLAALDTFDRARFRDYEARAELFLGDLCAARGRWREAVARYEAAQLAYARARDREWWRRASLGLARCAEAMGDEAAAKRHRAEAVEILSALRTDVADASKPAFDRAALAEWIDLASTEEHLELLHGAERHVRGPDAADVLATLIRRSEQLRQEELRIAALAARGGEIAELIRAQDADMVRTREELERLLGAAYESHPELLPMLDLRPRRLVEMMDDSRFQEDRAIVVYLVSESYTLAFVGRKGIVDAGLVPRPSAELGRLVERYRSALQAERDDAARDGGGARSSLSSELGAELYELLVRPIEGVLADAEIVGVVPMGQLSLVPFAALLRRDLGGEQYWGERQQLVYLSYRNVEYTLRGSRETPRSFVNATVSVLTNPTLDLRYAVEEADSVKALFEQTTLYPRRNATRASLRSAWLESDVLHVAAHAVFAGGGRDAYIQLSPPGREGRLKTRDIEAIAVDGGPGLVVLSACSTGVADLSRNPTGTHVETLASAFAAEQAGEPRAIVATLWNIDDRSSAVFMQRFYAQLRDGQRPCAALAGAQEDMIYGKERNVRGWLPHYAQPYHWGAFVHIGAWD